MATPEFKVGDRIRIKSWEQMKEEFGVSCWDSIPCDLTFTQGMKHLCWRTANIEDIYRGYRVYLKDWSDTSWGLEWSISIDMIEHVPVGTIAWCSVYVSDIQLTQEKPQKAKEKILSERLFQSEAPFRLSGDF